MNVNFKLNSCGSPLALLRPPSGPWPGCLRTHAVGGGIAFLYSADKQLVSTLNVGNQSFPHFHS